MSDVELIAKLNGERGLKEYGFFREFHGESEKFRSNLAFLLILSDG